MNSIPFKVAIGDYKNLDSTTQDTGTLILAKNNDKAHLYYQDGENKINIVPEEEQEINNIAVMAIKDGQGRVIADTYVAKEESDGNWEIGDIRTTFRSDLDDTWLYCDGSSVSRHNYSELEKMFPHLHDKLIKSPSYSNALKKIKFLNGYWIALESYSVYYSTDLINWSTSKGTHISLTDIEYANGYYVVAGQYDSSDAAISYTTSLNEDWTYVTSGIDGDQNAFIKYLNGYWITGGGTNNSENYIYYNYATSLDDWASKYLYFSKNDSKKLTDIQYINGQYIYVVYHRSNTSNKGSIRLYYNTEISSSLSSYINITTNDRSSPKLIYFNNQYIVVNGSTLYYSNTLTGEWKTRELLNIKFTYSISSFENHLFLCGQNYNFTGVIVILRNLFAKEEIRLFPISNIYTNSSNNYISNIDYDIGSGIYAIANVVSSGSSGILYYSDTSTFTLPSISNSYIKAK